MFNFVAGVAPAVNVREYTLQTVLTSANKGAHCDFETQRSH